MREREQMCLHVYKMFQRALVFFIKRKKKKKKDQLTALMHAYKEGHTANIYPILRRQQTQQIREGIEDGSPVYAPSVIVELIIEFIV